MMFETGPRPGNACVPSSERLASVGLGRRVLLGDQPDGSLRIE